MTTVTGSSRLILFASFRDLAITPKMLGIHPPSSLGFPSVLVTNIRGWVFWQATGEVDDFRQYAQLSHSKRSQLHLEGDKPLYGIVDRSLNRALALICFDGFCDSTQYPKQECAGARRRVYQCHCR